MSKNKALKYIYSKLYNNGNFTNLSIKTGTIRKINNFYKNNFSSFDNFDDFTNEMGDLFQRLSLSQSALCEVKKQFTSNKGLQPAILSECFVAQSIADNLGLSHFIDSDEKADNIPTNLLLTLVSFQGVTGKAFPRYIYHNDRNNIVLLQYGDSSSIDAIFVKDKLSVRIEIKEQKSKLSEPDISGLYDENGKLLIDQKFKEKYPNYISYINIFNQQTNVFNYIGHNFKIFDYLDRETVDNILDNVFQTKIIDLFILQYKNKIFPVISSDLIYNIDMSGSEIRTAGRNHLPVFTPNFLKTTIRDLGGIILDDIVTLPFNRQSISKGRNISRSTRYKLNSLLFVYIEKIKTSDNYVSFNINDIRQLKPTISIHLDVKINEQVLSETYINTIRQI